MAGANQKLMEQSALACEVLDLEKMNNSQLTCEIIDVNRLDSRVKRHRDGMR